MLTEWGQKLVSIGNLQNNYPGGVILPQLQYGQYSEANVFAKDIKGDSFYIPPRVSVSSNYYLRKYWYTTPTAGIYIGSDGTSPTKTNYTLGNVITDFASSDITPIQSNIYNENTDLFSKCLDYTVTNITNNSITIREIGYIVQAYSNTTKGATASSSYTKAILIDRTVLDTPLEIPAGEARTLRYEFIYG